MISFGIDIGGTFIKILAVNEKGKVLKNEKFKTPLKFSGQKFIKFLADIINAWCKELKVKKAVIGIGIAGDTDHKKGILRFAPNIPWHNFKIAEGLKKLTGFNTYAANDANVAAFGIYKNDLKSKYKNIIVLTLGTGVGGGIIINGKLYQGATGTAGEFGHIKIGDTKTGKAAYTPLTTAHFHYRTAGIDAAEMLLLEIKRGNSVGKILQLDYDIIERDSTGKYETV